MSTSEPSHAGFPISHVAQRTGLSIDALRWFEREGLFPRVPRDAGGRRRFSDDDIERVQLMLRLRRTGMPVRDMRRFIELLAGGEETHAERLELLFAQRPDSGRNGAAHRGPQGRRLQGRLLHGVGQWCLGSIRRRKEELT